MIFIFIVARTYMCAVEVARREGLIGSKSMIWLTSHTMHRMRGIDEPEVWVTDCGREALSDADREMIKARRPRLSALTCSHGS